ncbi:MAG: glutamine--fructose-6-phosphate transaminase (isomerizing) [Coprothermobacterota bacterium]|nr:glutamine--fructose-6-phosphate transaminase (isomerizing) [Coprothermobacterota bacterium]
MCGIVGYVGARPVLSILLDGLKKLEYRGYDSAGIVVLGRDLSLFKKQGKISLLESQISHSQVDGHAGIGHTRWATHGVPNDINAHPHLDCTGKLAVVHNGIIENYMELKTALIQKGHVFKSDTDTEVIPHLIEEELLNKDDLLKAVLGSISLLRGSFALAIIHKDFPEKIVCARRESPLVLGIGNGENFLASDIPALLPYTKKIIVLDNDEVAVIEKTTVSIFDVQGKRIRRSPQTVDWDARMIEKGGFEHFMLKEIHEQPNVIKDTMEGHLDLAHNKVLLPEGPEDSLLQHLEAIYITACGTAYHAGLYGKYLIEALTGVPTEVEIGSEFRYRERMFKDKSLGIVISQSGETADTLAAMRRMKAEGIPVFAITNVASSSVARESDWVFHTKAGPEVAVASTKAYTAQLLSLALFALRLKGAREGSEDLRTKGLVQELQKLPILAETTFNLEGKIQAYANRLRYLTDYFMLGRGLDYVTAMEGALKLKEISYVHCEAYPAGELKHGPLALITSGKQVCLLATQRHLLPKIHSNLKEVKARGAEVLILRFSDSEEMEADETFILPATSDYLSPLLAIIPLQLFAYYMAKEKGCDIDQPRNLAKSVTVE